MCPKLVHKLSSSESGVYDVETVSVDLGIQLRELSEHPTRLEGIKNYSDEVVLLAWVFFVSKMLPDRVLDLG